MCSAQFSTSFYSPKIITTRIRSTREGNAFTGVCPPIGRRGYPCSLVPGPFLGEDLVSGPRSFPGVGGTPVRSLDRGTPSPPDRTRIGVQCLHYFPGQDQNMVITPPHPTPNRIRTEVPYPPPPFQTAHTTERIRCGR